MKITNTGGVDSDEVVLGFFTPPGAGEGGVPLQSLFGFERVHVKAGESRVVYLIPQMLEFSQVDRAGKRYVLPGRYNARFGLRETVVGGGGFVEHSFLAV